MQTSALATKVKAAEPGTYIVLDENIVDQSAVCWLFEFIHKFQLEIQTSSYSDTYPVGSSACRYFGKSESNLEDTGAKRHHQ